MGGVRAVGADRVTRTRRATEVATAVASSAGVVDVRGVDNLACATEADVVLLAVPWDAHEETLIDLAGALEGKIVIDCVNPLGFDERGAFALDVEAGSAAESAQALLPGSRVVGAFHHVSAVVLADLTVHHVDIDVLVLAEDRDDAAVVQSLATRIPGARGVFAERLRNCGQVEALTANLIAINPSLSDARGHPDHGGGHDAMTAPTERQIDRAVARAETAKSIDDVEAQALLAARRPRLDRLMAVARRVRDAGLASPGLPGTLTYSRKVFIPLTSCAATDATTARS